jgi:hypothetical protein
MATTLKNRMMVLSILTIGLMSLGVGCSVTIVNELPDNGDDTEVGGSDPADDSSDSTDNGDSSSEDDSDTTPTEGNPNSPCADNTNIYVSYVNQSSARVVFVENFRDSSNQPVSSKILTLQVAGDADDTLEKCMTCPWQAGIRNINYSRDGVMTVVRYPSDLFQGDFSCGDQITFIFQDDESVDVTASSP